MRNGMWIGWIALTAVGLVLAGCTSKDENPNWDPGQQYDGVFYDAPYYYQPTHELEPTERVGNNIPVFYLRDDVFFIKHPAGQQENVRPRVSIWYSADGGQSWARDGYYGVEQTHYAFKSEQDARYWIRFVGPGQGVTKCPPGQPHRVYVVDTQPPRIHMQIIPAHWADEKKTIPIFHVGDTITIRWQINDANLIKDSVRLSTCYARFPHNLVWSEFDRTLPPSGAMEVTLPQEAAHQAGLRFRITARDKADNIGLTMSDVLSVSPEPYVPPAPEPQAHRYPLRETDDPAVVRNEVESKVLVATEPQPTPVTARTMEESWEQAENADNSRPKPAEIVTNTPQGIEVKSVTAESPAAAGDDEPVAVVAPSPAMEARTSPEPERAVSSNTKNLVRNQAVSKVVPPKASPRAEPVEVKPAPSSQPVAQAVEPAPNNAAAPQAVPTALKAEPKPVTQTPGTVRLADLASADPTEPKPITSLRDRREVEPERLVPEPEPLSVAEPAPQNRKAPEPKVTPETDVTYAQPQEASQTVEPQVEFAGAPLPAPRSGVRPPADLLEPVSIDEPPMASDTATGSYHRPRSYVPGVEEIRREVNQAQSVRNTPAPKAAPAPQPKPQPTAQPKPLVPIPAPPGPETARSVRIPEPSPRPKAHAPAQPATQPAVKRQAPVQPASQARKPQTPVQPAPQKAPQPKTTTVEPKAAAQPQPQPTAQPEAQPREPVASPPTPKPTKTAARVPEKVQKGWPPKGVVLQGGEIRLLNWVPGSAKGYRRCTLQFSSNAGKDWMTVAKGLSADRPTVWTVPIVSSDECRLRIIGEKSDGRKYILEASEPFRVDSGEWETIESDGVKLLVPKS